jgi:hypothetical protein
MIPCLMKHPFPVPENSIYSTFNPLQGVIIFIRWLSSPGKARMKLSQVELGRYPEFYLGE